ncbi:MAG: hypothetical protein RLZZ09_646 [Pseudomonadota bacterium]|jgi:hypothetical protein
MEIHCAFDHMVNAAVVYIDVRTLLGRRYTVDSRLIQFNEFNMHTTRVFKNGNSQAV